VVEKHQIKPITILTLNHNMKRLINRLNLLFVLPMGLCLLLSDSTVFSSDLMQPAVIVKLPENETVILVEKNNQKLFVYSSKDNELSAQFQAPCSTGEIYGKKQKAGDKKTPEGIYFLTDEYEDRYLSPIYGKKAFTTDYPNLIDESEGRTGYAIWIHGTNKALKPMDSNGCIALENDNILKLSDYVNLNSTPVILVPEIEILKRAEAEKQEQDILLALDLWIQAFEKGSYQEYSQCYFSDVPVPEITWWERWVTIRRQADELGSGLRVETANMGIYYHDHVFVVLFDCFLVSDTDTLWLGKKKVFLKDETHDYKIMGDVFQHLSEKFQEVEDPLITAAALMVTTASKRKSAIGMMNSWRNQYRDSLFQSHDVDPLSAGLRPKCLKFVNKGG